MNRRNFTFFLNPKKVKNSLPFKKRVKRLFFWFWSRLHPPKWKCIKIEWKLSQKIVYRNHSLNVYVLLLGLFYWRIKCFSCWFSFRYFFFCFLFKLKGKKRSFLKKEEKKERKKKKNSISSIRLLHLKKNILSYEIIVIESMIVSCDQE